MEFTFIKYLRAIYKTNLEKSNSVHRAIIQSVLEVFVMAHDDLDLMKLELSIKTAHDVWLDEWGSYFEIYRRKNENDEFYRKRILDSLKKPKATIPGMQDLIAEWLNVKHNKKYVSSDVKIIEPWKKVAKYSHRGSLSHSAYFYSEEYYNHAVIEIQIPEKITEEVKEFVNTIKACGVKVVYGSNYFLGYVDGYDKDHVFNIWCNNHFRTQMYVPLDTIYQSEQRLSHDLYLSGQQIIGSWVTSYWYFWAKDIERFTDDSILLDTLDKLTVLQNYHTKQQQEDELQEIINKLANSTLSDKGTPSENLLLGSMKVKDTIIDKVGVQLPTNWGDMFTSFIYPEVLSDNSVLSTDKLTFKNQTETYKLFLKVLELLEEFKKEHSEYYNSLQAPIQIGRNVLYYIRVDNNTLMSSEVLTFEELEKYIDAFDNKNFKILDENKQNFVEFNDFTQHTITSVINCEDNSEHNKITITPEYHSPMVISSVN